MLFEYYYNIYVNVENEQRVYHKASKSFFHEIKFYAYSMHNSDSILCIYVRFYYVIRGNYVDTNSEGRYDPGEDKRRRSHKLRSCKSNVFLRRSNGNGLSASKSCIKMRETS